MLKKEMVVGPSCLTAAAEDEPVFLLRANDEDAPGLVLSWANRYKGRKTKDGREMTEREMAKYLQAIQIAGEMLRWKSDHP